MWRWNPGGVDMSRERADAARREKVRRMVAEMPAVRVEWSIGIYAGDSPLHLAPATQAANPVLTRQDITDVRAEFVADPFMLQVQRTWYMFFEVMNRQRGDGEIGLATSAEGLAWTYQQIVLAEPFHLSYPYIFRWRDDFYMIPETAQARAVRVYRAIEFPRRWSFVTTLLRDADFHDTSVFRHDGMWWLFTETNPQSTSDTLRLFHANDLMGPWSEHPMSPIVGGNPHIARPAGRIVAADGGVIRYAQDCHPTYGRHVRAFQITELTTVCYRERDASENPVLCGSGYGWNALGMHHVDPHQADDGRFVACVDGWTLNRY